MERMTEKYRIELERLNTLEKEAVDKVSKEKKNADCDNYYMRNANENGDGRFVQYSVIMIC